MSALWQPTPAKDLFVIKRYDRELSDWRECRFDELKAGDIFASFSQDGVHVDPSTGEACADVEQCSRATADAYRNEAGGVGDQVPADFGLLEDLMAMGDS